MSAYLAVFGTLAAVVWGTYALLMLGPGGAIRDAFISPPTISALEAELTPPAELAATVAPTLTPQPATPTLPPQEVGAPAEGGDCEAMRGRPYESKDDRIWFLGNCVSAPNRADCEAIRGTPYQSRLERDWYLLACT